MSAQNQRFTFVVFTEDTTGLLSRVVSVFTRRHVNINSLTTSASSSPDIYRFTITAEVDESMRDHLISQLNKQVDVLRAFAYGGEDIVQQEIALYKIETRVFSNGDTVEKLVRAHNARILSIEPEYVVIERTGHQHETEALLTDLRKIGGVLEFVRSGTIAIVKPMEQLNKYLQGLAAMQN